LETRTFGRRLFGEVSDEADLERAIPREVVFSQFESKVKYLGNLISFVAKRFERELFIEVQVGLERVWVI